MRIGIGPYYLSKYGVREGGERMRRHGYDCLDLDRYANTDGELYCEGEDEFVALTEGWRDRLSEGGYNIWQIHGPWRYPPNDSTPESRAERFDKMSRALLAAKILGAEFMAIHPLMPFGVEKHTEEQTAELWRINIDFYTRLAAVGEKHGVVVCLENMPFPDFPISSAIDIMKLVTTVNHPYLRVCLDTGHANVVTPTAAESVKIIGKDYLKILHVHGNDGTTDSHLAPGHPADTVDWDAFREALCDIGFDGVVNLETSPDVKDREGDEIERRELALAAFAKRLAGV